MRFYYLRESSLGADLCVPIFLHEKKYYYPCGSLFCRTFFFQATHAPLAWSASSTSSSRPSHSGSWTETDGLCHACMTHVENESRISHWQNHSSLGASLAAAHVKLQRSAHTDETERNFSP